MDKLVYDGYWLLVLLVIPLILLFYYLVYIKREPVFSIPVFAKDKKSGFDISPRSVLLYLRLLALVCIVLALCNPRLIESGEQKKMVKSADIVLALDLSKSMLAEDIKPNRLEVLKKILTDFTSKRLLDKIAMVSYAGESSTLCPLTIERKLLLEKIRLLDTHQFADGTAIGEGMLSAVNAVKSSENLRKTIILISDGENNAGDVEPMMAARIAKKLKIKVHTIGIGSSGLAPFPIADINGRKTYVQVSVHMDTVMLKRIAEFTRGRFFKAGDRMGLDKVFAELDKEQATEYQMEHFVLEQKLYAYFVVAALMLMLIEFLLAHSYLRIWQG